MHNVEHTGWCRWCYWSSERVLFFWGGVFLCGGVGGGGDSRLHAPKGEAREGRRLMVQ